MLRLTPTHIQELDAAVASVVRSGLAENLQEVTRERFPLPTLEPLLGDLLEQVVWGRGFALIKGIPVDRYTVLVNLLFIPHVTPM